VSTNPTRTALVIGLLGLLSACTARADADYYRWVDGDGQVHYSQQPPADRPAEARRHRPERPGEPGPDSLPAARLERSAKPASPEPDEAGPEGLPAPDPALCAQARQLLHSLSGPVRMRARHPDGHHVVLTEADRQEQRQLARQVIEHHCP